MPVDNVRLSQPAKDRLIYLKRTTGITQWNVLCRWALLLSLKEPSTPLVKDIVTDSNVEMNWKTFAGQHGDVYLALLKQRCVAIGEHPTDENLARLLTVHLHRGIGYLGADKNMATIEGMVNTVVHA
ncbi:DNA sulfur modification protein DndE [Streptomyces sp. BV129]|uniref:DNA sulfur modification protein DndE n=1 Tax=Streptomyces sp. BV129 TaxID=2849671 RepID=UPI001C2EB6DD|nr:DNA sulfur modification protein DndE [Streptomyces sp. BV129]MBV1949364.1 DNA sulfur modification protein DndE [Streptomyces sp. BV129]MBV1949485.1 DNA sulfur modification protein DndE [Streptomyces sp. BV129]